MSHPHPHPHPRPSMIVAAMSLVIAATSWVGLGAAARTVRAPSTNWLPLVSTSAAPPARTGASIAYDAATATAILFGGLRGEFLADTWTWNGASWTMSSATGPSPRSDASMAYDAATHELVLFGGVGPSGDLADTWTWNGASWTMSSATGPSPRSDASMAYDAATHELVLFGGVGPSGDLGDTWTWNGASWTMSSATGPSPRSDASMAYDAATHQLVLYGGRDANGALGDTWTGDGTTWTPELIASPAPRYGAVLVSDNAVGGLVLFGGTDGVVVNADTWSFVTAPTAPRSVRATSDTNATSVVTWTVPASDGGSGITGYVVTATDTTTPNSAVAPCDSAGPTTCTFSGLTNGDHYVFSVAATTSAGVGVSATSNVAIPATVPGAPTITSVLVSQGGVRISWTPPVNTGGIPLVGYRAIARPGGASCHVAASAKGCVVPGLRLGSRFTFSVYATNAAGNGSPSNPSASVVVRATPGPPIITSARSSRGRIVLQWRGPSSNGGSRVTGYNVYVGPVSGAEATSPLNARPIHALRFSFRGRKGYRTFIEVRAVNSVGVGTPSRQVMVFTP